MGEKWRSTLDKFNRAVKIFKIVRNIVRSKGKYFDRMDISDMEREQKDEQI